MLQLTDGRQRWQTTLYACNHRKRSWLWLNRWWRRGDSYATLNRTNHRHLDGWCWCRCRSNNRQRSRRWTRNATGCSILHRNRNNQRSAGFVRNLDLDIRSSRRGYRFDRRPSNTNPSVRHCPINLQIWRLKVQLGLRVITPFEEIRRYGTAHRLKLHRFDLVRRIFHSIRSLLIVPNAAVQWLRAVGVAHVQCHRGLCVRPE